MVKDAKPIALSGKVFTLEFQNPLFVDKIERNEKGRKTLEDIICKTLDTQPGSYRIKPILHGTVTAPKVAISAAPHPREAAAAADAHSPFFDEVIAVFGGQILDESDLKG
jgi:hypothetical protein